MPGCWPIWSAPATITDRPRATRGWPRRSRCWPAGISSWSGPASGKPRHQRGSSRPLDACWRLDQAEGKEHERAAARNDTYRDPPAADGRSGSVEQTAKPNRQVRPADASSSAGSVRRTRVHAGILASGSAGRGRPPQAAARRAGLEFVEKLLTERSGCLAGEASCRHTCTPALAHESCREVESQ
jgi:hypothetical protein